MIKKICFINKISNIFHNNTMRAKKYNLNITKRKGIYFELKNYVMVNDGKYHKYNYEINNIYYCPDNIIIDYFNVINTYEKKEKYILFDYFILDLENKTIKLYDESISDSFVSCFKDIKKIVIKNENNTKNKIIYLYSEDNKMQIIKLNDKNQLIYYKNDYVYNIKDKFLYHNKTLKEIKIPNIVKIKNSFLWNNNEIINLNFPKLIYVDNFLCMKTIV